MVSKSTQEPIRPPQGASRQKQCRCGRKALFVSHARRSDGRMRAHRSHPVCPTCFRRVLDAVRALRVKQRLAAEP